METKRRIRPELEGLRAIAAILVAIYHIWFNRVSGGVDVFFVVSGLLITTSLISMYWRNGKIMYLSYIVKLMKRLLPTARLIGITTLIASIYILPIFTKQQNLSEFLASAFYFQNWRLAIDSVDYLAQNNTASPFQHFWALSIQFQFYLAWLLLFLGAISILRIFAGKQMKLVLIVLISLVTVVSFSYSVYLTAFNQPFAYYHTFTRIWEFGVGGILALIIHKLVIAPRIAWVIGWLGLIGLISCGIILQVSQLFPGYAALWPVLSAVLIIVAGNYSTNFSAFQLLSWKPLVKFGSISYAFYLWHWPLLIFYYALFDVETVTVTNGLFIMAIATILAYITIYGFELPIRKLELPIWKTAGIIGLASGAILISSIAYQENSLGSVLINSELLDENYATHPGATTYLRSGRLAPASEFEEPFIPSLEIAAQDRSEIYADGCILGPKSTGARVCEYGSLTDFDYTIALVGGSHSAHWQPMLVELANAHNFKIITYLKGNCRFTLESVAGYPDCEEWFSNVTEAVLELNPDLIFTIGTIGDPEEDFNDVSGDYIKTWKYFEDADIPLFLVRDTPWYKNSFLECLSDNVDNPENCKVKRADVISEQNPLVEIEILPEDATAIDLTDYFCDDEYCHSVVGNVITHFDRHHLTATFSRSFAPIFEEPLLKALENAN